MTVWTARRPRAQAAPTAASVSTKASDATVLWSAAFPLHDLVTKKQGTVAGSWVQTMGPAGLGCRGAVGGTPHLELPTPPNATSTDYTVFAYVNDDTNGANRSPIDGDNQTSARVFQLRFKADDGVEFITFDTSGNPYFATGPALTFTPRVGLLVGRIVANALSVWWQGKKQATGFASNAPKTISAADLISVACVKGSSGILYQAFPGQVLLAGHINRGWTDSEIQRYSDNPLLLLPPIQRMWWSAVVAGGGGGGGTGSVTAGSLISSQLTQGRLAA